jgi:hypothetical protein
MSDESKPAVLRAFLTLFEADVAWSAIDAADITARLADDNLIRLNFWFSNALGGVKLIVSAPLAEEAIAILDTRAQPVEGEDEEFPRLPDDEKCKSCGGDDFAFRQNVLVPIATFLVFGFPLGSVKRVGKCRRCGAVESTPRPVF